jgi:hypothetical protein
VVIRPVAFTGGIVHRREAETSGFWYRPADEPAAPERFLIVRDDGETCPDVAACVALAVRQFGPPSRRLAYGDAVILVWPHPISEGIGP